MTQAERKAALANGISKSWQSEPWLGSYYGEEEIEAVVKVIRDSISDPSLGFGFICDEIKEFERVFAEYIGTKYSISIANAGVGLDMMLACLDLSSEDEVIVPAINFQAALMAVLGQGAKLVMCEVDPVTLCADPNDVERRITPNTRAILPTHMNGISAPMKELHELAERHPHPRYGPLKVIGDGARALGASYRGEKVGKPGWMNVFSFHTMKNITTLGEGGAITTDDDEIVERLRQMRHFGPDLWGSNYKMTKVQAVVGPIQLRRLDGLIAARRGLAKERSQLLSDCPYLTLPTEPEGHYHSFYLYTILVDKAWAGDKRDQVIKRLLDQYGVHCLVLNRPVYQTSRFVAQHTQGQRLPLSEELGGRIFCPPIHPRMSHEDNRYIAAAILETVDTVARGG
jgi:dTDP-4-amino-4,6-dideoxygalactose transaminase